MNQGGNPLKILMICFSQTGNTRKLAECIRQGILKENDHCQICDLETAKQEDLAAYDLVGLGCPVFYYQEPYNVRNFLAELPILTGKIWFLFCTHGSIIGNTFHSMTSELKKKEVSVIGYHDTYADAWLPFYPHPTYTSGHPDARDFEEAQAFGKGILKKYKTGDYDNLVCQPATIPAEWVQSAARFTPQKMPKMFPPLELDLNTCTQCLVCEDECPVDGIDVSADPPMLQTPCIYCWRCVNVCPEKAIQADWQELVKLAPKLYERYRYWLDQAAAEDRFRWLVDPESIDFTKPFYLQKK
jgi:flavodoxin/ferredoxin